MKVLKIILIVIVLLVGVVLAVAAFLPSEYKVSRSIEINRPVEVVFKNIDNFKNRPAWDPWLSQDPDAEVTYAGPDSGVGASYSWKGETIGSGTMTIEEVVENESIKSKLEFTEPRMSASMVCWKLESTANGTKATWTNRGKLGYPIERFFGLMLDGMLGPDFEKGLQSLKKVIEAK